MPFGKGGKPTRKQIAPRKYRDWEKIKLQFLASGNESLMEFGKRIGINSHVTLYQQAKRGGWLEERRRIIDSAARKVIAETEGAYAEEWREQIALLKGIELHVAHILKDHMDENGNVTSAIEPSELKALAEVVSKGIISRRHIRGDDMAGDVNVSLNQNNLHLTLVKRSQQIEDENGMGPTLLDPPE